LRAWQEVVSHQQKLEKAKLQMEILRAGMELGLEDAESLDRIRGIAKRIVFDERLLGSPEHPPEELPPLVIASVVHVVIVGVSAYVSAMVARWLYGAGNLLVVLAYAFAVSFAAYRHANRLVAAGKKFHPIISPLLGGAAIGGIWGLILAIIVQRKLASSGF